MRNLSTGVGAIGALMLMALSPQAHAAPASQTVTSKAPSKPDDVPAPPMALLFGIGAVGLFWGRRLAANARKVKEQIEPGE